MGVVAAGGMRHGRAGPAATLTGKATWEYKSVNTRRWGETDEKHRGAAIHWFQNGHPMKALIMSQITHHDEMLAVSAKNGTEAKDKRFQPFGNRGR